MDEPLSPALKEILRIWLHHVLFPRSYLFLPRPDRCCPCQPLPGVRQLVCTSQTKLAKIEILNGHEKPAFSKWDEQIHTPGPVCVLLFLPSILRLHILSTWQRMVSVNKADIRLANDNSVFS